MLPHPLQEVLCCHILLQVYVMFKVMCLHNEQQVNALGRWKETIKVEIMTTGAPLLFEPLCRPLVVVWWTSRLDFLCRVSPGSPASSHRPTTCTWVKLGTLTSQSVSQFRFCDLPLSLGSGLWLGLGLELQLGLGQSFRCLPQILSAICNFCSLLVKNSEKVTSEIEVEVRDAGNGRQYITSLKKMFSYYFVTSN